MEKEKKKKKKKSDGREKREGQEVLLNRKLQNEVPDRYNSDRF